MLKSFGYDDWMMLVTQVELYLIVFPQIVD